MIEDKIKQAEAIDLELFDRIDRHRDLYEQTTFNMKDGDGQVVPGTLNIHIPEATGMMDKFTSLLSGGTRQIQVDSEKLKDKDRAYISDFLDDSDIDADEGLNRENRWPMRMNHAFNIGLQGWGVQQVLTMPEDGRVSFADRCIERRWVTSGSSRKGLDWVSVICKRNAEDIEAEYGHTVKKEAYIRNVWTKDEEIVYLDESTGLPASQSIGTEIARRENIWGEVPFVIQSAPVGSPALSQYGTRNWGQSIYYTLDYIFDEIDWLATLAKTMAFDGMRPALQGSKIPEGYPKSGELVEMPEATPGNIPLSLIPRGDFTQAQAVYKGIIDSFKQQMGYNSLSYGDARWPMSGAAIAMLMSAKDSIMAPRMNTLALLTRGVHTMRLRQIQTLRKKRLIDPSFTVGDEFMERDYEVATLAPAGGFTLSYQFFNETLEELSARASIAQSVRGMLPDKVIRRDILRRQNPDEDDAQLDMEDAERIFPEIKIIRVIHALIDTDTPEANVEAWTLLQQVEDILKAKHKEPAPIEGVERPQPSQATNLFKGGGGRPQGEMNA